MINYLVNGGVVILGAVIAAAWVSIRRDRAPLQVEIDGINGRLYERDKRTGFAA